MRYAKPEYTKGEVNRAGIILLNNSVSKEDREHSLIVINNWRASHNFPLNTFINRLRRKAKEVDEDSTIAQRLKRLTSIRSKLLRIEGLKLAQIQDIGGCRAIVGNIDHLDNLVKIYKSSRGIKHQLFSIDDYIIDRLRVDGYRSVHFVYKYNSDKNSLYDSLKIEIQIRTRLQHAWATAVETIDTFTNQSLKTGEGEPIWGRFFSLVSSVIALRENRPVIPNTSSDKSVLRKEIIKLENELKVLDQLQAFTSTVEIASDLAYAKGAYFLLTLDIREKRTKLQTFNSNESIEAARAYTLLESEIVSGERNVVLVSSDSIDSLKLAYPNYYADTSRFVGIVEDIMNSTSQLSLF